MATHDFWTDDRKTTLTTLWSSGMTTKYIAAQIGCTKNAVVGKINRLGLPTRSGDGRALRVRKPSNANPRSPVMPIEERREWCQSIYDRMQEHGISHVRLAVVSGTSDTHLCRLRKHPETYRCTYDFKRRVEEGLAHLIGRNGTGS